MTMENQHRLIKGYRDLSKEEIDTVNGIKYDLGVAIEDYIKDAKEFGGDPRCIALAETKFQEACMWLIRSITKPESFV